MNKNTTMTAENKNRKKILVFSKQKKKSNTTFYPRPKLQKHEQKETKKAIMIQISCIKK